jgi:hypothetical protein
MRLGRWQQSAVYATLVIVALTGLVWLALHDVIEEEASDLQRWSLILHGISAFAALIVFGSLLPLHVRSGWLRQRNIASGLSITIVMAVLIGTALLLYYGGEEMRMPVRWLHIGVGILGFGVFPIHVIFGHRSRLVAISEGEPTVAVRRLPAEQSLRRERREPIRASNQSECA